jgi:hypothetical protein
MCPLQRRARRLGAIADEAAVMGTTISVRPINSILFLSDEAGGEPPVPIRGVMIQSTPSTISFRCYPEQDGPTEVLLGQVSEFQPPQGAPAFDDELKTPSRSVVLSTADWQTLLRIEVPNLRTRVRIWLNHSQWPDKVTIGLSQIR